MMKSQKGVTMITLILYVASFFAITALVAGITTFFYNNVEIMDTSIGSNILNECKKEGTSLWAWKNNDSQTAANTPDNVDNLSDNVNDTFITFEDSAGNKNSFIYVESEKNLYYNSIKLCEEVEEFKFKIDYSTGKTVLNVFVNIEGTSFSTEYVLAS